MAKKIRETGTKLFRDGGRADIYSPEIEKTVRAIESRMLSLIKTKIEHIRINKVELS